MFYKENITRREHTPQGRIEVICGCMFSGKTEELIRRLNNALQEKQKVVAFNPEADTRHGKNILVSHNNTSLEAISVENAALILTQSAGADVVGIDEAQFFDEKLTGVCNVLANKGYRVIVAGLDMDYLGNPFGPIPALMAIAESVTKLQAVCDRCGAPASYSYRLIPDESKVLPGDKNLYEPRCRECYKSEKTT